MQPSLHILLQSFLLLEITGDEYYRPVDLPG
ncbi:uncharacterized protein METZ01_LOCUS499006 [marine metagenome]|uniref:Uncharacterized protein n=1 Tax=marine metagenome TaxID=408172 RepID=A0A383DNT1_9ZZZZ